MMRNHQWRLVYEPRGRHAGADLTFGTLDTGIYTLTPPSIEPGEPQAASTGPTDSDTSTSSGPTEDGTTFGIEFLTGATITFELGVDTVGRHGDTDPWAANLDAVAAFSAAWQADAVRTSENAVAELYACRGGRQEVTYGRPRKIAPAETRFTPRGYTSLVAEFVTKDNRWYEGVEQTVVIPFAPPPAGGLVAPLAAPLSTVAISAESGTLLVAGTVPTWPVITFRGPITNPTCDILDLWALSLGTTLAHDEQITVDTRPWRRTVTRHDGANMAGWITPSSPLMADMVLPPGQWEAVLRGQDITGASSLVVAWRGARPHP